MRDVLLVATIVAFFLLAAAYVAWCDRIVGPDEDLRTGVEPDPTAADAPVEAVR